MHVGIAYLRWRGKRSRHSRRMRTRNFTYLSRGPCVQYCDIVILCRMVSTVYFKLRYDIDTWPMWCLSMVKLHPFTVQMMALNLRCSNSQFCFRYSYHYTLQDRPGMSQRIKSMSNVFGVYSPRCFLSREINTKISPSWVLKQIGARVHTLFYISVSCRHDKYYFLLRCLCPWPFVHLNQGWRFSGHIHFWFRNNSPLWHVFAPRLCYRILNWTCCHGTQICIIKGFVFRAL